MSDTLIIISSEQCEHECFIILSIFQYIYSLILKSKQNETEKTNPLPLLKVQTLKIMIWEDWFLFFFSFAGIFRFSYIIPIKIRKVAYLLLGWESGKKSK